MAIHDVSFDIPRRPLGKSDLNFFVRADGEILGKLSISNGSIVWFPKLSRNGLKMGWKRFDEMMQENARRREKRKP
jgi:hypothetical protein